MLPGREAYFKSKLTAATASVIPNPWVKLVCAPCSCKKSSILLTFCLLKESPPAITYFKLLSLTLSIRSLLVIASNRVGTPTSTDGLYLVSNLSNSEALNVGIETTLAPTQKASFILTSKPNPWNIGIIPSITSLLSKSGKAIFAWIVAALKFPLDKTIPLGVPVEPPLCNMAAGKSFPVETLFSTA